VETVLSENLVKALILLDSLDEVEAFDGLGVFYKLIDVMLR